MIKFSDLELKPRYEPYFDDLCCLLSCFSGGRKYLNGDDSDGHIKVALELERHIELDLTYKDPERHGELKNLNDVFNSIKFYYYKSGDFKTKPQLHFPIKPEHNLLGAVVVTNTQTTALDEILQLTLHTDAKTLTNRKKLGLLALRLAFECGQIRDIDALSILQEIALKKPVHNIESLFFIDYPKLDDISKITYVGRVILSPLTFSMLCDVDFLKYLQSDIKLSLRRMLAARIQLVRSQLKSHDAKLYSEKLYKRDLQFFALNVLPGFLAKVSGSKLRSYCLPLSDFARLHDVLIKSDDQYIEDKALNEELDEKLDEDGDEDKAEHKINIRYFSERDLKRLIDYIEIHPTVSRASFERFRFILILCFYLGLRRSEALFLRKCDVFPLESTLITASMFVRETDLRGLKSVTSKRHQPLTLLPPGAVKHLRANSDFSSEDLLIGMSFKDKSSQYFFDRLSRLIKQLFGINFVLHMCRHSYISNGALQSMAGQLHMEDLASASSFIGEIVARSEVFRSSFRLPKVTGQHLTNVSQSAGHAKVETTLSNYLHSTDILTWAAMCAHRPETYPAALAKTAGVTLRTIQRWNRNKTLQTNIMNYLSKSCGIVKTHTEPVAEIDDNLKASFKLYKAHYDKELRGRELKEWIRLHKRLCHPEARDLVELIADRLNKRSQVVIKNHTELMAFKSASKLALVGDDFWEARANGDATMHYYQFEGKSKPCNFPLYVRVSYKQSKDNAPRRTFSLLIKALKP